ncbi:MAG: hypothetical protein FK730_00200 [Asgard group archaeon]|nr:hypothetical protein [Asgard group archaeon]
MCHLAGYIGNENCMPIILDSLEIQEGIIGAQATGIAIIEDGKFVMEKDIGPVKSFRDKIFSNKKATIGIGHTRYAIKNVTKKESNTQEKAHPFWNSDKSFLTMHNGTINNYERFVQDLEAKGYHFRSKTAYIENDAKKEVIDFCDSEIFSYLLEEELKRNDNIKDCIRNSCLNLKGQFAFVVLHPEYKNKIILANWMQPMYVGLSKEAAFFSSFLEGFDKIKSKIKWIFEPPKNTLITLERGKITIEPLLPERNIPNFQLNEKLWFNVIEDAIKLNYNDLARIWVYTNENPESINLTREEYDELMNDGFTMTPLIYSYLQEMEKKRKIIRKLELVWEGGVDVTPRYKFYMNEN